MRGELMGSATKICASIKAPTIEEFEEKAEKALEMGADLIEFRLDYLQKIDLKNIAGLLEKFAEKSIFTLRPTWEGGYFSGGEEKRLNILAKISEMNPAYIDMELDSSSVERKVPEIRKKAKLIISKHDFDGSLNVGSLRELASKALKLGEIAKIVVSAKSFSDNLKILSLYDVFPTNKLIAFAMGERGIISRIVSSLIGAPIAYACLPGEEIAPGQLSVRDLKKILELARGK